MNSLEPFIRHELENQPGTAAAPQANSTRNAPPLGSMPLQPRLRRTHPAPSCPHRNCRSPKSPASP